MAEASRIVEIGLSVLRFPIGRGSGKEHFPENGADVSTHQPISPSVAITASYSMGRAASVIFVIFPSGAFKAAQRDFLRASGILSAADRAAACI